MRFERFILWFVAFVVLVMILSTFGEARAQERVDNAVIFVADVSDSMDADETRIVRQSHARAITSHEVLSAISVGAYQRSAFAYIEFAATARVVVGWTVIDGPESAARFAEAITADPQYLGGLTSIGEGLALAAGLFDAMPFEPLFMTVDVTGDGQQNNGTPLELARAVLLDKGVTINGLPMILRPVSPHLSDYYARSVMGGPRSFLLELHRITDMPVMLRRKLILELY